MINLNNKYFLILFVIFFTSCASTTGNIKKFERLSSKGKYLKAGKLADSKRNENLLWSLESASSYKNAKKYKKSIKRFDEAEKLYKHYNESGIIGNATSSLTSVLLNDSANEYTGDVYEGVFINVYKAINFATLGDMQNARIEFNRASDRQRRAKISFEEEIKERKKSKKDDKSSKTLSSKKVQKILASKYSNLNNFKVYSDFVNPYVTYISGLFFALSRDKQKAEDLLKEAYAMTNSKVIATDLTYLNRNGFFTNSAWVVLENGTGPRKGEFRVDLPLYLVTGDIVYSGIALPKFIAGKPAVKNITVNGKKTKLFADINSVVVTEFKKNLPTIKTKAIISAITKTLMQKEVKRRGGALLGMGFAALQATTTKADRRSWTSLPSNYQLARVSIPRNKKLKLVINGKIHTVLVNNCNNAIVNVKIQKRTSKPVISIIRM